MCFSETGCKILLDFYSTYNSSTHRKQLTHIKPTEGLHKTHKWTLISWSMLYSYHEKQHAKKLVLNVLRYFKFLRIFNHPNIFSQMQHCMFRRRRVDLVLDQPSPVRKKWWFMVCFDETPTGFFKTENSQKPNIIAKKLKLSKTFFFTFFARPVHNHSLHLGFFVPAKFWRRLSSPPNWSTRLSNSKVGPQKINTPSPQKPSSTTKNGQCSNILVKN